MERPPKMKVVMSRQAAAYVRQEAANLRNFNSPRRADHFLERIKSVRRDIAQFARMGFEADDAPLPGARRLVRDGYRYDYQIEDGRIVIIDVSSSVNTPQLNPTAEDIGDYEEHPEQNLSSGPGKSK